MRIFILIKDDPIYQRILENIIIDLKDKLVGIGILPVTSTHRNNFAFIKTFFIMLGPVLFFLKAYQYLRNKALKYLSKLFNKGGCYSIDAVAKKHAVNFMFIDNLNEKSFIEKLKIMNLDVIVSLQSQIIKSDLLNVPKIGIVNVHAGMLPLYRGPAPFFWALMNGDKCFGLTSHFMDNKIDNGPILIQKNIRISSADSYYSLTKKVEEGIPTIVLETIKLLENGNYVAIPNDGTRATYCPYPSIIDAIIFRLKGKKTI